jgi:SAM-dependent methyltransferase
MTEQYVLADADHNAERARLDLLEAAHDPTTQRRLAALGIAPGWRCLEVGAGGGSIVRWLADQVGASGSVVAADINTRFLVDLPPNVEVRDHDLRTMDFEPDSFDLVHCRSVLMHLPDKPGALRRLVAALRPGGWLCAEEGDWGSMTLAGHPDAAWADQLRDRALEAAGGRTPLDVRFGRRLPGLVAEAGCTALGGDAAAAVATEGSPVLIRHRMDMALAAAGAVAFGVATQDEIDRFLAIVADPGIVLLGGTSVGVWGRKPSGGE